MREIKVGDVYMDGEGWENTVIAVDLTSPFEIGTIARKNGGAKLGRFTKEGHFYYRSVAENRDLILSPDTIAPQAGEIWEGNGDGFQRPKVMYCFTFSRHGEVEFIHINGGTYSTKGIVHGVDGWRRVFPEAPHD